MSGHAPIRWYCPSNRSQYDCAQKRRHRHSGRRFSWEVPMLLHRRISLALAHLRAARYDGCADDIKRAERRLNGLLDELPRPIREPARS